MSTAIAPGEKPAAPAPGTPRKGALSDRAKAERSLGWKLAGPAFAVMLLVTLYPILSAVWLSFFRYRLTDPNNKKFNWGQNYAVILQDPAFWKAVGVTALITVITVVVEFVLGMAIALLMHRIVIPSRLLRTIVLIPYSIITVVSAFSWMYAFSVDTGFINRWLHVLTFGSFPETFDWFGSFWPALTAICFSEIWKTTPFMSLLLLAGLAQIDDAMLEAARVDGATAWQRLTKVTLPNMKPAIMVAVLFRTLDAWRIFDNIFIMTGGSQGTSSFSLLTFNQTINRVEIGMGSALSVLLFLSVVLIALLFIKLFKVDLAGGRR